MITCINQLFPMWSSLSKNNGKHPTQRNFLMWLLATVLCLSSLISPCFSVSEEGDDTNTGGFSLDFFKSTPFLSWVGGVVLFSLASSVIYWYGSASTYYTDKRHVLIDTAVTAVVGGILLLFSQNTAVNVFYILVLVILYGAFYLLHAHTDFGYSRLSPLTGPYGAHGIFAGVFSFLSAFISYFVAPLLGFQTAATPALALDTGEGEPKEPIEGGEGGEGEPKEPSEGEGEGGEVGAAKAEPTEGGEGEGDEDEEPGEDEDEEPGEGEDEEPGEPGEGEEPSEGEGEEPGEAEEPSKGEEEGAKKYVLPATPHYPHQEVGPLPRPSRRLVIRTGEGRPSQPTSAPLPAHGGGATSSTAPSLGLLSCSLALIISAVVSFL